MKREWIIDACSGKCIDVTEGQRITVVDLEGGQVVDFFAVSAKDTSEFLSTGVTIDCNESLRLHVGDLVYSNLYRPMFQILSDDVGEHDLLHPCCLLFFMLYWSVWILLFRTVVSVLAFIRLPPPLYSSLAMGAAFGEPGGSVVS